ncbi:MAG TPA: HDOD domain-containing protein, partial [Nitrosomonas sp.]|nr:HDOD domain-containing protein [Nitrosomonas sp.]
YHFAKPEIISGKRVDANKLPLLNLLTMVMGDCEAEEIETELKHQPNLSYNLLRLVNSVGFGLQQRINSIKQAVIILGRQQLQRWVQLLLYTSDSSGDSISNALMQTAAVRGKLMELIAQIDRPHDKTYQDRAFMVGIFSLLDTLLGMEMQQIVDKLNIPEELTQALLQRSGRLGRQLALIEANEKGDVTQVQSILKEINFLTLPQLTHAELEALSWTNRINETAH